MGEIVKQGGDLALMWRTAEALAGAGNMLPRHLQGNPGAILAVAMTAQELGIGTMVAIRGMYLIHGRVGMEYPLMIALLRRAGYSVKWEEKSRERASLRLTNPEGESHVETWDVARATQAKLWGTSDPWKKYPDTMLAARCVSSAARAFAGEVLAGCYSSAEEIHEVAAAEAEHVSIIDPEETYDNPRLAAEANLAVARADEARERMKADIGERIEALRAEVAQAGDDEAELKAIAKSTAYAIKKWLTENLPEIDELCAHPKGRSRMGVINTALWKWGAAGGNGDGKLLVKRAKEAAREALLHDEQDSNAEAAQ